MSRIGLPWGLEHAFLPPCPRSRRSACRRLYFSAKWCGPCLKFTPLLAGAYRAHREHVGARAGDEAGDLDDIEVVFVSLDSVQSEYDRYRTDMPWLTVPWPVWRIKDELSKKYGVNVMGIPALIVLDGKTGQVVSKAGREEYVNYFKGDYATQSPSGCVLS